MIDAARYLAALNRCFPGWGDERMFAWAFRGADFIVANDYEAGSAVTYRNVQLPDGTRVRTGIMTGSWTMPEARGRGHFSRIIDQSLELARKRDAAMLIAFVTATNASGRRLEAAGATIVPSFYCHSERGRPTRSDRDSGAVARFTYTETEWRDQFLTRPRDVKQLRGDTWSALLEHPNRILSIEGNFDDALNALGDVFFFTTLDHRANGFDITPGFVTVLPIRGDAVTNWDIQNGDRM